MIVVKAPNPIPFSRFRIFLAGSIEMGAAEDWQEKVTRTLSGLPDSVVLLNPRRDDWDSSWAQSVDNANFREQVEWELLAMEISSVIAMHFDPNTKSPITLLEFGLWITAPAGDKLVVHCPKGFWRRGNVEVTARWWDVALEPTLESLIETVKRRALAALGEAT